MKLKLRGKSATQSHRAPIFYVDLTLRAGMTLVEAVKEAKTLAELRQSSGIDQLGLDQAARQRFAAGAFVEEFYPAASIHQTPVVQPCAVGLADKLSLKRDEK